MRRSPIATGTNVAKTRVSLAGRASALCTLLRSSVQWLLTVGLLGPSFAVARELATLSAAVLAGVGARAITRATPHDPAGHVHALRVTDRPPVRWRLETVLETVDHATAWVVVGIVAAAVAAPFIDRLRDVPHGVLVALSAIVAVAMLRHGPRHLLSQISNTQTRMGRGGELTRGKAWIANADGRS